MKETTTMMSTLSVADLNPNAGKKMPPSAPAILEVDLGDRSRSSSRPPPSSTQPPPLTSFRRRRESGKFSLEKLRDFTFPEWPCRDMTNFHCYLLFGLICFFIFWLLLLLRIYLPDTYFHGQDPKEAVLQENVTEEGNARVLNETATTTTTDTNLTENVT